MGNIRSIYIMNVLSLLKKKLHNQLHVNFLMMLLEIFTTETSFQQVYIDSVHFCNYIFFIKCFHNIWNHLNGEINPFNLKNTITEMFTCWKLISIMNIYLNLNIYTCETIQQFPPKRQPTSLCCRQQPTEHGHCFRPKIWFTSIC